MPKWSFRREIFIWNEERGGKQNWHEKESAARQTQQSFSQYSGKSWRNHCPSVSQIGLKWEMSGPSAPPCTPFSSVSRSWCLGRAVTWWDSSLQLRQTLTLCLGSKFFERHLVIELPQCAIQLGLRSNPGWKCTYCYMSQWFDFSGAQTFQSQLQLAFPCHPHWSAAGVWT